MDQKGNWVSRDKPWLCFWIPAQKCDTNPFINSKSKGLCIAVTEQGQDPDSTGNQCFDLTELLCGRVTFLLPPWTLQPSQALSQSSYFYHSMNRAQRHLNGTGLSLAKCVSTSLSCSKYRLSHHQSSCQDFRSPPPIKESRDQPVVQWKPIGRSNGSIKMVSWLPMG